MDNNHDVNVTNTEVVQNNEVTETGLTSLVGIDAEVLGELRKDKIGKPKLVLVLALLFALVLAGLPILNNMLNDTESVLYKFLYESPSSGGISKPQNTTKKKEYVDGSQLQQLSSSLVMMNDNIMMKNFKLSNGKIECTMYSYNGLLELDDEHYYLELYSNSKELLSYYKLGGTYDFQERKVVLERADTNFNTELKYFGKIVKKEEKDMPEVKITQDVNGIGNMTCEKGNNKFVYTFKNGYLIQIANTDKKLLNDMAPQEYLNLLADYRVKATKLTPFATVEEVEDGFVFNATVNLETAGYVLPSDLGDPNYYKLDTKAKVISYAMIGKGFDCK